MNFFNSSLGQAAAEVELCAEQLSLSYGDQQIIQQLSLSLPQQQITAIIGPNGCGKSTLLSGLARVLAPKAGHVLLNGQSIQRIATRKVAQQLALLPQEAQAPDGLTVLELIRFGRQPHQGFLQSWSAEDEAVVQDALRLTNLQTLADQPLNAISGGQRQRAWLAMTVAQSTPLLLLDELTSALDLGHQIEVFEIIQQLAKAGKTIVMVVHDMVSACRYADHIVALKHGQIMAQGKPAEVITSALIEQLYGVHCHIMQDPHNDSLLLTGIRSADSAAAASPVVDSRRKSA